MSVITICGSMRFYERMLRVAEELTASGNIVLMPFVIKTAYPNAEMLDELHREKILMSDAIFVVTASTYYTTATGTYIGESTLGEIEFAQRLGKIIHYQPQVWGDSNNG